MKSRTDSLVESSQEEKKNASGKSIPIRLSHLLKITQGWRPTPQTHGVSSLRCKRCCWVQSRKDWKCIELDELPTNTELPKRDHQTYQEAQKKKSPYSRIPLVQERQQRIRWRSQTSGDTSNHYHDWDQWFFQQKMESVTRDAANWNRIASAPHPEAKLLSVYSKKEGVWSMSVRTQKENKDPIPIQGISHPRFP